MLQVQSFIASFVGGDGVVLLQAHATDGSDTTAFRHTHPPSLALVRTKRMCHLSVW